MRLRQSRTMTGGSTERWELCDGESYIRSRMSEACFGTGTGPTLGLGRSRHPEATQLRGCYVRHAWWGYRQKFEHASGMIRRRRPRGESGCGHAFRLRSAFPIRAGAPLRLKQATPSADGVVQEAGNALQDHGRMRACKWGRSNRSGRRLSAIPNVCGGAKYVGAQVVLASAWHDCEPAPSMAGSSYTLGPLTHAIAARCLCRAENQGGLRASLLCRRRPRPGSVSLRFGAEANAG
jgi:hypothetical protein